MGNTFYVLVWGEHEGKGNGYSYKEYYRGESYLKCQYNFWKARKWEGYHCVKMEWR